MDGVIGDAFPSVGSLVSQVIWIIVIIVVLSILAFILPHILKKIFSKGKVCTCGQKLDKDEIFCPKCGKKMIA